MTYRSLLVLLDAKPLCAMRTQAAIRLAKTFDAHLTGLAPTGLLDMPSSPASASSLADLAARAWDMLREEAAQTATRFRDSCTAAGLHHFEAVVEQGDIAAALLSFSHCHDLVVLTQAELGSAWHARARMLVEQSVLSSARPTLVLPSAGSFDGRIKTAMVAWDDSREAARAVADAMPLLMQAEAVHLVSWKENGVYAGTERPAELDRLRRWLLWHGVAAQLHTETTSGPISEAMLSCVAELQADVLVMGAYGHARWAQRMLGGATSGLLAAMTVPVLMSH